MPLSKEERAAINRKNAQKSTGPRTAAGKARSRLNARKHGLTGHLLVLESGDRRAYNDYAQRQLAIYKPDGRVEEDLVQHIIDTSWMIHKANAYELNYAGLEYARVINSEQTGPLGVALASHHFIYGTANGARHLEALGRHRARLERSHQRQVADLKLIQKHRRENEANPRTAQKPKQAPKLTAAEHYRRDGRSNAGEIEIQVLKEGIHKGQIAHKQKPEAPQVTRKVVWVDPLWLDHYSPEDKLLHDAEMERRVPQIEANPNPAKANEPNARL